MALYSKAFIGRVRSFVFKEIVSTVNNENNFNDNLDYCGKNKLLN